MNSIVKQRHIDKFVEVLKFDGQRIKFPILLCVLLFSRMLHLVGRDSAAFNILCKTFGTGWWGSFTPISRYIRELHSSRAGQVTRILKIRQQSLASTQPDERTKRFFDDPTQLFVGMIIVVKEYEGDSKGVVIINYSSYFVMVAKLFDIKKIAERYVIVLEPSWAGFCDMSVLIFTQIDDPVLVMTFEERDRQFLEQINTNLIPVDLGNGWWVDHRLFIPTESKERDFDIIMVAAWAAYKRHYEVFKALGTLKKRGKTYRVALAGYSGSLEAVKYWADHFGVTDWITFYDSITPAEVGKLYARSKVNILWSRFEGNNRAIIEGMLCDTPCIIRAGHNYGQCYEYINAMTGEFSSESELPDKLTHVIENYRSYSPREYVLSEHSCFTATDRLQKSVHALTTKTLPLKNETGLAVKLNMLDGMEYFDSSEHERFEGDYKYLASCIALERIGE